ncbi:Cwf15 Cwc15 cell cycle control protein [Lactarius hatsudake]|nr:Cwf15 Cwc15 cell cycle control protein [Lactarius hatsudake]
MTTLRYRLSIGTGYLAPKDPAQAIEVKGGSRQYSVRDMAAHTKRKFRQPGQTSVDEVKTEAEARAKMRKAAGLPVEDAPMALASEDEEAKKRQKDADRNEGDGNGDSANDSKGNTKRAIGDRGREEKDGGDDDGEDDGEDDDTVDLLRELERIKRERAAEQACVEQAKAERGARIATANPLLNHAATLGDAPGINTTAPGTFTVKRRWDDGDKAQGQFVNDLLRTGFHK